MGKRKELIKLLNPIYVPTATMNRTIGLQCRTMAEYTYNNLKHALTKISPFYANYRFKPRSNWPTEIQFSNSASELYGHYMNGVRKNLRERLEGSVERMKKHYNKKRKAMEPLRKGEVVILNGQNIRAKHRCKKLEDEMLRPFEVLSIGSNLQYCKLKLPEWWKIHPVFNIDLLERYKGTNPKKQIIEIEADGDDLVMVSILASRSSDDNPKRHVILVKWKDFGQEENTLETYENVADHNLRLLEDYYQRNPAEEKDGRFK